MREPTVDKAKESLGSSNICIAPQWHPPAKQQTSQPTGIALCILRPSLQVVRSSKQTGQIPPDWALLAGPVFRPQVVGAEHEEHIVQNRTMLTTPLGKPHGFYQIEKVIG